MTLGLSPAFSFTSFSPASVEAAVLLGRIRANSSSVASLEALRFRDDDANGDSTGLF